MIPKIQILATGGTFDKEYDELHGNLFFRDTHLPEMIKTSRCTLDVEVKKILLMDSLDMTDTHRQNIADHIVGSRYDRVIVTHGTDRMVDMAKFVAPLVENKTVIFTGAMIPFVFGTSSDGFFNMGCALSFVQMLPAGVYIVMNGQCFHYDNVVKNLSKGEFERLNEERDIFTQL